MKKASIFLGILLSAFLFSMIIFKIIDINESKKMDFDSVRTQSQTGNKENNASWVNPIRVIHERMTGSDVPIENPEKNAGIRVNGKLTKADWDRRFASGLNEANLLRAMEKNRDLFCYQSLSDELKQLYCEIYILLSERKEETILCSLDEKDIDTVYQYVMLDHPEIFYICGYEYTKYTSSDKTVKIGFCGKEEEFEESLDYVQSQIDSFAEDFCAGISKDAGDYEKVKYTYEYVIFNTTYNINANHNQSICSVILYGQSVCQGYAKTIQFLLGKLGVSSTIVYGVTKKGEMHSVNLVEMDEGNYYLDATWGDSSHVFDDQGVECIDISYDYLLITTKELAEYFLITHPIKVLDCNETQANYYVKENLLFSEYDIKRLNAAFEPLRNRKTSFVTIKCTNRDLQNEFLDKLIGNQDIFSYLPAELESINYSMNEELCTLTFYK